MINFDKLAVPLYRRSPVAKLEESNDGNKTFEVQVYQVHLATFHVHAQSTAEAIRYLMNGDGDELLDSAPTRSRFQGSCNSRLRLTKVTRNRPPSPGSLSETTKSNNVSPVDSAFFESRSNRFSATRAASASDSMPSHLVS